MLDDGAAAASWVEFADQRARLRVRRVEPSGRRSAAAEIAGTGAAHVAGHPRLARSGRDLVLAWTESDAEGETATRMQVRVATATIPAK